MNNQYDQEYELDVLAEKAGGYVVCPNDEDIRYMSLFLKLVNDSVLNMRVPRRKKNISSTKLQDSPGHECSNVKVEWNRMSRWPSRHDV